MTNEFDQRVSTTQVIILFFYLENKQKNVMEMHMNISPSDNKCYDNAYEYITK